MLDKNIRRAFAVAYLLCGIGFLMLASLLYRDLAVNYSIPVVFHATETLNSPLKEGEKVRVRIYRDKVRDDCPVVSNRRAQNQVTGQNYDIPNAQWPGGPANTTYLDYEYDTSDLPAGDYVLFVNLTYQCPEFLHDVEQPVTFFRIEERGAPE